MAISSNRPTRVTRLITVFLTMLPWLSWQVEVGPPLGPDGVLQVAHPAGPGVDRRQQGDDADRLASCSGCR